MTQKSSAPPDSQQDHHGTFFRLIRPEQYPSWGIDPRDVPMGTFAAEDHPTFLPSRFGGNAYGLGVIEQSVLSRADTEFLEGLDFHDLPDLGRKAGKLNAIYQKLGLLIRFSRLGKRFFLIPINLLAHSLQDIKTKADAIEELVVRHMAETNAERLDIGLLTGRHDLIVHELTARLSNHRIFLFESLDKLRSWRLPLDIVAFPKDIFEYLLEQQFPRLSGKSVSRRRLFDYAAYVAGKVHDLLEANGKLVVLTHSPGPDRDRSCRVHFKSSEELKIFLLFTHVYRTQKSYAGWEDNQGLQVQAGDLHYYLNRFALSDPQLQRLLDDRKPADLSLEQIGRLAYLNLRLPQAYVKNPEQQWRNVFEPYFAVDFSMRQSVEDQARYWRHRLEIFGELPESLCVLVGRVRCPEVSLHGLEEELHQSGMQGCNLPLVAEYRNSFRYVLDVLRILVRIRDHDFPKLSELERTRLSNPFYSRNEFFKPVTRLLRQLGKIEKTRDRLNPDHCEGPTTPILENIPKLALLGFTGAQLREMLLIVLGHTCMSRVVFGKLPAKMMQPITDRAREGEYQEILKLLRVCRLMSMAEIAAALGPAFTAEQARELYHLCDDAVHVATDPALDWEKLHDLRISALGGVQNKAIREMLKFFNLFEFLDSWQEFIPKGRFQKQVICDYEPDRLEHLEQALELVRTANRFKRQFLDDYVFGQSYFFRQFLATEFHGTGHLFPKLGTRAGFILLWIAVNASKRHILNFNPMLAGIPQDRHEERIRKIAESLLGIPTEQLHPGLFQELRHTLEEGRPAFVLNSGMRLTHNPATRAIDVSFVDVDENLRQLEALLPHFASQSLRSIALKHLLDLERLFSELESYHQYFLACQGGGTPEAACGEATEAASARQVKGKEIERIELELRSTLQQQVFIPEEIFDTIRVLARHCPEVLRFMLPEFHAFGNLIEIWPARQKQSLGTYVMRCLEKFQALINKDRNAFQDGDTFYQLAKQEFGALAEEGVGAGHAQLEILEYVVDRVKQRPFLYQALNMALLLQEIGKVERYTQDLPQVASHWTHAEAGALVLEQREILRRYQLDPQVERLVIFLVRHHSLLGHVIQGEEPVILLQNVIGERDDRLLDAVVLHAVLSVAAVREGLMVADLVDVFLGYRATALQIIKSGGDWQSWLREDLREKGRAVLADQQSHALALQIFPGETFPACGFVDRDMADEPLWRGRQIAALERLLKLLGVAWIDFQDLQMHLLRMPVTFIYHKKKLKSFGPASFARELKAALKILDILASLEPEVRYYLLYCLDSLGAGMRLYDFAPLAGFLDLEQCLKLLLIGLQAFHHHFGMGAARGLVSFRGLSRNIGRRHRTLGRMLQEMPFPERCFDGAQLRFCLHAYSGLCIEVGARELAVRIGYQDAVQMDQMVRTLAAQWDHEQLRNHYEALVRELRQKTPHDIKHFEKELKKRFAKQQKKINDRILRTFQERLDQAVDFAQLQQLQGEIHQQQAIAFTDEQHLLLEEMFQFHRARLRERYLDAIYQRISRLQTPQALTGYWQELVAELFAYRSFVGKEYESMIAELVDRRMEELEG